MIHIALLTAALLLPQAAAAPPTPNGQVLIWQGGVSPQGIDHKDIFANHGLQVSHRDKSGDVEVHLTKADVMVIQSGTATLLYGGEGVGMHSSAENEML